MAEGPVRPDLFFRLNLLPVRMPALRERREDIPHLVHFFVARFAREMGKPSPGVSQSTMERLVAYDWLRNVRELQNVIERAAVLATGPMLEIGADSRLATAAAKGPAPREPVVAPGAAALADVGRDHILRVLERSGWAIKGEPGAAHVLGMRPSTLRSRMKKLGLQCQAGGVA